MTQLTTTVQFQSRGILNIPKAIRETFQISKGTIAKIFVKGDVIVIRPVETVPHSQFKPQIYSKNEIALWLKQDGLDKKTVVKLDAKLKEQGLLQKPNIEKWLEYYKQ